MKGFIVKEFLHIFRDRRTMLILFGMPIVQVLLFGFAITNEINNAQIAILDHSKDNVTTAITAKMLASGYFQLNKQLESSDQIASVFQNGEVKEVIVFEPDFAQKISKNHTAKVQIITDASDPNSANLLASYTSAILMDYVGEFSSIRPLPVNLSTQTSMLYNPELKGVFMFVPGTITILLMLISAMMTSISIAREKEMGTMEVLLVSHLKPLQIIIGKVIPYILLSFVNALVILFLAATVFHMPMNGSMILLLSESMLFIIMALSMGIFISTISNTQQTAMLLSMFVLMLPTILLSGFIFPIENMPVPLQLLSNIMPSKWFIIIVKSIMLKGLGIAYFWKETIILAGMMSAFVFLSAKKFKIRLA
ncbi:MAG: multidrug ABC transporter permease [Bacteroidetes bacterium HGW-Bacteroidetes-1]|nr:MAG: multidrug ABC transporter permease [Bacteroidetes bacterium HGW-Bacteroidetes-1]